MTQQRMTAEHYQLTQEELLESDIAKACVDLLHVRGYHVTRVPAGKYRTLDGKRVVTVSERGMPDYVATHGIHPAIWVEVKRPRGKAEPHQLQKIRELHEGFRVAAVVVDSARALAEFLTRHERSP
jgi:predicted SAM-dependent methyltransferase